jgi:hypothetical protein
MHDLHWCTYDDQDVRAELAGAGLSLGTRPGGQLLAPRRVLVHTWLLSAWSLGFRAKTHFTVPQGPWFEDRGVHVCCHSDPTVLKMCTNLITIRFRRIYCMSEARRQRLYRVWHTAKVVFRQAHDRDLYLCQNRHTTNYFHFLKRNPPRQGSLVATATTATTTTTLVPPGCPPPCRRLCHHHTATATCVKRIRRGIKGDLDSHRLCVAHYPTSSRPLTDPVTGSRRRGMKVREEAEAPLDVAAWGGREAATDCHGTTPYRSAPHPRVLPRCRPATDLHCC